MCAWVRKAGVICTSREVYRVGMRYNNTTAAEEVPEFTVRPERETLKSVTAQPHSQEIMVPIATIEIMPSEAWKCVFEAFKSEMSCLWHDHYAMWQYYVPLTLARGGGSCTAPASSRCPSIITPSLPQIRQPFDWCVLKLVAVLR